MGYNSIPSGKLPQIYRFEMLYWRGVSRPAWWNNYAKELFEYLSEQYSWMTKKMQDVGWYNSNSKGRDFDYSRTRQRILQLKPRKISKHPLIAINYDEGFILVDSEYTYERILDWIDLEYYRQYGQLHPGRKYRGVSAFLDHQMELIDKEKGWGKEKRAS